MEIASPSSEKALVDSSTTFTSSTGGWIGDWGIWANLLETTPASTPSTQALVLVAFKPTASFANVVLEILVF